jgi:hypothetical protein
MTHRLQLAFSGHLNYVCAMGQLIASVYASAAAVLLLQLCQQCFEEKQARYTVPRCQQHTSGGSSYHESYLVHQWPRAVRELPKFRQVTRDTCMEQSQGCNVTSTGAQRFGSINH